MCDVDVASREALAMEIKEDHVELTPVEARGGRHGRRLLIMLVVSGVAAIGLMSAFWIFNGAAPT